MKPLLIASLMGTVLLFNFGLLIYLDGESSNLKDEITYQAEYDFNNNCIDTLRYVESKESYDEEHCYADRIDVLLAAEQLCNQNATITDHVGLCSVLKTGDDNQ